jgi:hypothetical protein
MTHDVLERYKSKRSGNGASFPVEAVELPQPDTRSKSKRFEAEWVKLPIHWVKALRRAKGGRTHQLAHAILAEFHKRQRFDVREVVLSTEVTGMGRNTKLKAAKDLERLGLITLISMGGYALRAIPHLITDSRKEIEKDLCSPQ